MMTCTRMEQLIPLYVEGDLETDAASAVLAHMKGCESCRALVAEYEASQDWLRTYTPPDFDAALLDSVRLGVMQEIREPGARPTFFARCAPLLTPRRILAATTAALMILAAFALDNANRKSSSGLNRVETAIVKPGENKPAPRRVEKPDDVKSPFSHHQQVRHSRRKKPASRYVANDPVIAHDNLPVVPDESVKPQEMLRIELQTADPNIRIIWFSPKAADSPELKPMIETR